MSRWRHLWGAAAILAMAYVISRIAGVTPTYMECLILYLAAALYLREFD